MRKLLSIECLSSKVKALYPIPSVTEARCGAHLQSQHSGCESRRIEADEPISNLEEQCINTEKTKSARKLIFRNTGQKNSWKEELNPSN